MTTEHLLELLRTKNILIFGTGFVAERFWQALELHGFTKRVSGFTVSKRTENNQIFHGCPVYGFSELHPIEKETVLCLAVHETALPELRDVFSQETREQCIWIYPYLWELLCGPPVESGIILSRHELLKKQNPGYNWISVRYLAMRDFLEHSADYPDSADLYCRAQMLHCGAATAKKRLKAMETLAESIRSRGLDRNMPILIDTSGRILDGLHRFAAAFYFKIDEIPATVLPTSEHYDQMLNEKNQIPDSILLRAGFSAANMDRIHRAKRELTGSGR